jgi:hypothetical protein
MGGSQLKKVLEETKKHKLVYPLTNFKMDSSNTAKKDVTIIRLPYAPHLLFPEYMCEAEVGRAAAMSFCFSLLHSCDEVIFGTTYLSPGMREELHEAIRTEKPVYFYEDLCM